MLIVAGFALVYPSALSSGIGIGLAASALGLQWMHREPKPA